MAAISYGQPVLIAEPFVKMNGQYFESFIDNDFDSVFQRANNTDGIYGRLLNEFSNSNIKYQNNEKLCINITPDTNYLYLDMTVLFLMNSSCLIVDVLTFESVINLW